MLPPQRSADERQHPNARRTPAVDEDGRAEGARSGRRPSGVVGTLVGASTGIGTFVGGVAYAVLWNAYASFYGAFGLTPEDVGLSRERLVVPAILAGLVVMGMLAALAIGVWTGTLDSPGSRVDPQETRAGPAPCSVATCDVGSFRPVEPERDEDG